MFIKITDKVRINLDLVREYELVGNNMVKVTYVTGYHATYPNADKLEDAITDKIVIPDLEHGTIFKD